MSRFEKVDFFTDTTLVDDPVPYYEYLHTQGPVVPLPDRNCVAVVGFDECVKVFRDTEHYSSVVSPTGPIPALPFAPEGDDIGEQIERFRGDMPYAGPALAVLVAALRTAPPEVGAAVAVDAHGMPNPLLAAYRVQALRGALPDPAADRPAKLLLEMAHVEVRVDGPAGRDVDTPEDLAELGGGAG